jgi:two-component system, chemotaxis family, protein-glutamate methylesterase/glutaminase
MQDLYAQRSTRFEVLAIGASTGGPPPLRVILSALPPTISVPVLIVQHITKGFTPNFVQWLSGTTGLPVHLAEEGMRIQAGHVYVARDGLHMSVGQGGVLGQSDAPAEHGVRPAVSYLFRSISTAYGGACVGVLLSGMGRDGAEELGLLREQGAVTFAQDEASCVVFGMPGEAVKRGAAAHVMPPDQIAGALVELLT